MNISTITLIEFVTVILIVAMVIFLIAFLSARNKLKIKLYACLLLVTIICLTILAGFQHYFVFWLQ